ncbi:MAG: hypothetical protein ACM32O_12350 [Clostridia bacterium]
MNISDCCGAETKVVTRVDHPHVYDDMYELLIPVRICTKCGRVLEEKPLESRRNDEVH